MKRELKKALKLPGMQSHINRKRAYWKTPSEEMQMMWARHRIADMLHVKLNRLPLSQLLSLEEFGIYYLDEKRVKPFLVQEERIK